MHGGGVPFPSLQYNVVVVNRRGGGAAGDVVAEFIRTRGAPRGLVLVMVLISAYGGVVGKHFSRMLPACCESQHGRVVSVSAMAG